ncbi:MAG: hypothetical protein ACXVI7_10045 [Halobacteriota archaeon]
MVDWHAERPADANVEELRHDIRYAVAWMQEEYHDFGRSFTPELVVRTVVNAVRTLNASYTDGVVLAEFETLTPEFIDVFDKLTDGAFSLTLSNRS